MSSDTDKTETRTTKSFGSVVLNALDLVCEFLNRVVDKTIDVLDLIVIASKHVWPFVQAIWFTIDMVVFPIRCFRMARRANQWKNGQLARTMSNRALRGVYYLVLMWIGLEIVYHSLDPRLMNIGIAFYAGSAIVYLVDLARTAAEYQACRVIIERR